MAQNNSIFSLIFLALIIFGQGLIQSIEGRYLKSDEGNKNLMKLEDQDDMHGGISTTNVATLTNVSPPTSSSAVDGVTGAPPAPGHGVDDFRPTAPGHSPGVGHSIHN